ncbi:MAG: hypothetical protein R3Y58_09380 [Eubacteriales bacterium]
MKREYEELNQSTMENINAATMFVSFDLVNCTLFKSTHKGMWASGVSKILEDIIHIFANSKINGYRFWKIIGDEVVYTINIQYIRDIDDILAEIYRAVVDMNCRIRTAQIGDSETAKYLSTKATVWMADISPANLRADNFYTEYMINENILHSEYLGTDIDTGFRIAKYTQSNRVVISFEVAALFLKEEALKKDFDKVKFVGLRTLKGIWNGRKYPIFMYHGDEKISFEESIRSAELGKDNILLEYLEELPERTYADLYNSYEEQLLTEYCNEDLLNLEVVQLVNIINAQNGALPALPLPRRVVHYTALCYMIIEGKVKFMLVEDEGGRWGFGGAIMNHNLQYIETISLYYEEQFGYEIVFANDHRYHDPIPLIIDIYHTEENTRGTLFLAEIKPGKNAVNTEREMELERADKVRFFALEEITDFSFYDCNDSVKEILKKALTYIGK